MSARPLVIVPTLNEERHIAKTLRQIIEQRETDMTFPVIVADGGSTDTTREIVASVANHSPDVRLVDNPGKTQAAAMNLLLAPDYDDYDVFIRCDAHSYYPPRFVADLVETLIGLDVESVTVPMDTIPEGGCFQRGVAWIADTKLGAGGSPHRGGETSKFVEHGHHAAFRASTFRSLGGYDTSFIANEDAEYDRRLIKAGCRIWLESKIRIGYVPRASAKRLWTQYYNYGQGRAQTCLKHRIRPQLRQLIPLLHVVLFVVSLCVAPFTILGLVWPGLYLIILILASLATAFHHRSPCGLFAGPALAIMHFSWGLGFLTKALRAGRGQIGQSAKEKPQT